MNDPSDANSIGPFGYLVAFICCSILVFLFFPWVDQFGHRTSIRTHCLNNVRQLVLALQNYESANEHFPPASTATGESYLVRILGELGETVLRENYRNGQKGYATLSELSEQPISLLICPNATKAEHDQTNVLGQTGFTTHYYASMGPAGHYDHFRTSQGAIGLRGLFSPAISPDDPESNPQFNQWAARKSSQVRDGLSNTIAIFESSNRNFANRPGQFPAWTMGHQDDEDGFLAVVYSANTITSMINLPPTRLQNEQPLSSNHPGGCQVGLVDGSARFLYEDIDIEVLRAISTIDGGENRGFDE